MSDLIRIVDLAVEAHIGVPEEERRHAQRLLISLEISVATISHAAKTDDISRTVNYYDVAQRIRLVATRRPRKLIETLAEEIATELIKTYPMQKLALEIKKFILPDTQYVSVRIERTVVPVVH
jgi:phosphoglycolate phosphatase/dihydroneopterin aldolase